MKLTRVSGDRGAVPRVGSTRRTGDAFIKGWSMSNNSSYALPNLARGDVDLIVLPQVPVQWSLNLVWFRVRCPDGVVLEHTEAGKSLLGICGGFQLLGRMVSNGRWPSSTAWVFSTWRRRAPPRRRCGYCVGQ